MTNVNTIIADLQADNLKLLETLKHAEAEITELTDGKTMINKWFQETFRQLASAQAENLKLREALNKSIQCIGGNVTHDLYGSDADLADYLRQAKVDEDEAIKLAHAALSTPSDTTALNEYVTHAVAKRLEELGSWVTNEATHRAYRDSVLEEAAKVFDECFDSLVPDRIRAMKESK